MQLTMLAINPKRVINHIFCQWHLQVNFFNSIFLFYIYILHEYSKLFLLIWHANEKFENFDYFNNFTLTFDYYSSFYQRWFFSFFLFDFKFSKTIDWRPCRSTQQPVFYLSIYLWMCLPNPRTNEEPALLLL